MAVDVDLALSAHANSRALYDAKKKATEKAARTVEGGHLIMNGGGACLSVEAARLIPALSTSLG